MKPKLCNLIGHRWKYSSEVKTIIMPERLAQHYYKEVSTNHQTRECKRCSAKQCRLSRIYQWRPDFGAIGQATIIGTANFTP